MSPPVLIRAEGTKLAVRIPCENCGCFDPHKGMTYRKGRDQGYKTLCLTCELFSADPGNLEHTLSLIPGSKRPFDYQLDGVRFLRSRNVALLADEMGLGKTAQALLAIPEGYGAIVLCRSGVDGNWAREVREWRTDMWHSDDWKYLAHGNAPEPGALYTITYERLKRIKKLSGGPWVLIVDEAHRYRNEGPELTQAFRRHVRHLRAEGNRVWALTATPIFNGPDDLKSLLRALGVFKTLFGFTSDRGITYTARQDFDNLFWWHKQESVPRDFEKAEIYQRLRPIMARRLVEKHQEHIRPVSIQEVKVPITKETAKELDALLNLMFATVRAANEARAQGADPEQEGIDKATKQARQAAIHARAKEIMATIRDPRPEEVKELVDAILGSKGGPIKFEDISRIKAAMARVKITAAMEIVERHERMNEPLLVFCSNTAPLEDIAKRDGWGLITGKIRKRKQIAADFQAGKIRNGLAITTEVGSEGFNLTRAAYVLSINLDWTPAKISQAYARANRQGQTRQVRVYELTADHPIEHMILDVIERKREATRLFDWREIEASVPARSLRLKHPLLQAPDLELAKQDALEDLRRPKFETLAKLSCRSCRRKDSMIVRRKQRGLDPTYERQCKGCGTYKSGTVGLAEIKKWLSAQDAFVLQKLDRPPEAGSLFVERESFSHTSEVA